MESEVNFEEDVVSVAEENFNFFDSLTAFNVQSPDLLSSMELLSEEIDEAIQQLSSIPTSLYEAEKVVLFGDKYNFKSK
jgi:hypothetical protein